MMKHYGMYLIEGSNGLVHLGATNQLHRIQEIFNRGGHSKAKKYPKVRWTLMKLWKLSCYEEAKAYVEILQADPFFLSDYIRNLRIKSSIARERLRRACATPREAAH